MNDEKKNRITYKISAPTVEDAIELVQKIKEAHRVSDDALNILVTTNQKERN